MNLLLAFYTPIAVATALGLGVFLAMWVMALRDCYYNQALEKKQRRNWLLLIFFTFFIGAGLYFAYHQESRPNRSGEQPQV